jgi:hypothetical protein
MYLRNPDGFGPKFLDPYKDGGRTQNLEMETQSIPHLSSHIKEVDDSLEGEKNYGYFYMFLSWAYGKWWP